MGARQLPADLVALVHHVELAESGWRQRLIEQMILGLGLRSAGPTLPATLREQIQTTTGLHPEAEAFNRALETLRGRGVLVPLSNGQVRISESARKEAAERVRESEALALRVKQRFVVALSCSESGIDGDEAWTRFCNTCLDPLVNELGARTYEFLVGDSADASQIESVHAFLAKSPASERDALGRAINAVLDPGDSDVRVFIFQRLHTLFLALAAHLPEDAIEGLSRRTRGRVELRLFLDTNFLFSLLHLHEHPANEAVLELVGLLEALGQQVQHRLYVLPITVDEARRTLHSHERRLSSLALTPHLSRAASVVEGDFSGIALRFMRVVRDAPHGISADAFFGPYVTDLMRIFRDRHVELYNDSVDKLMSVPEVAQDVSEQESFELRRFGQAAKPTEAIRHDVLAWHFVKGRRDGRAESPLEAVDWLATLDFRLLGFDRYKRRQSNGPVAVCIHPAVLIQMLQLWVPRSELLERALFQSL